MVVPRAVGFEGGSARVSPTKASEESTARIQFVHGVDEKVVPTVSLTRSANSRTIEQDIFFTGTATFWFQRASSLYLDLSKDRLITGMFLIDEEGAISTTDVTAKFERGKPLGISSVLVLSNPTEWRRFMRFMTRYSEEHGLQFTSADPLTTPA
ncbi:hypothetical protein CTAYLR_010436 [Chrysophaeum taylorii]|uniref:Photosystem II reaction center Psb28 protein n=1 Tax=Chrysophaeum taylorii TaxID=2483200 RepID=A0AAD7U7Y0_9STRA|nr:hypothetical protein CTAYLR_010436 [Chrysophaeum taylorii]